MTSTSLLETIRAMVLALDDELAVLNAAGHSLDDEEEKRRAEIDVALPHLKQARQDLEALYQTSSFAKLADGRYLGITSTQVIDLRIDEGESKTISGDIAAGSVPVYVASFCTQQSVSLDGNTTGTWPVTVVEYPARNEQSGTLTIKSLGDSPLKVEVELTLADSLDGLESPFAIVATWTTATMRSLGIETELEQGIVPPPTYDDPNVGTVDMSSCLTKAGFEVSEIGLPSTILPTPRAGGARTSSTSTSGTSHRSTSSGSTTFAPSCTRS